MAVNLTFTVGNIDAVMEIYDRIQIMRFIGTSPPSSTIDLIEYTTISGRDSVNDRDNVSDIVLNSRYSQYYYTDPVGVADDWYISRYYNDADSSSSAWADPILGEAGDIYYNPMFPPEIEYGTADQMVISRIRTLIGDPKGLRREYGDEAQSSIHSDGKTYEMDEKGWPSSIMMNNIQYPRTNDYNLSNPSINGYRFLRFTEVINTTTWSGCQEYGVDIWYYTFRFSDKEIMDAYDRCPPPPGLSTANSTSEAYMTYTSIDLIMQEGWEDAIEDGAKIADEGSTYDPSPGLGYRKTLLATLQKRLDTLINALVLKGIEGVRVD